MVAVRELTNVLYSVRIPEKISIPPKWDRRVVSGKMFVGSQVVLGASGHWLKMTCSFVLVIGY